MKILQWTTTYFSEHGIETARLDAELLLAHVLNYTRVQLYTHFDQPLGDVELKTFKALLQRRAAREPLAYLLGEKEFYSLNFWVDSRVLIPRPETEELVEHVLNFMRAPNTTAQPKILDLGTGSACIPITLLHYLPQAEAVALDKSIDALQVAKRNAQRHQVESRLQWLEADLLQASWIKAASTLHPHYDVISANLPYVSEADYAGLQPEILHFEPKGALVPGPKGQEIFAAVLPHIERLLSPGGLGIFEMGEDQGEDLSRMAEKFCPNLRAEIIRDLSAHPRFLRLQKN